jgi:glycosyltransferase involved in cell wall biosynthesis
LERSLTVLLPVRNAQATLASSAQRILEVLADLTGRFELVIIDDGSADATSEVLQDLTRLYPQIRAICRGRPQGREEAVRTGLANSRGDIVLLCPGGDGARIEEVRRLWGEASADRPAPQAVHAYSKPARPNYLARLRDWVAGE